MFLVVWSRKLGSLPFLWLGQLANLLKSAGSVSLLKTAFAVNGDGRTAHMALLAIQAYEGPEAALEMAMRWLEAHPRPQIAAYLGLAAAAGRELDTAKMFLEHGRKLGADPDGLLDSLDYRITAAGADLDANVALARRFEARKDLPPQLSRFAVSELMWDALLHGRFEEAGRRAAFVLEVDDNADAEAVLWALAEQRGDHRAAQTHSARIAAPRPLKLYVQFLGSFAIGARDEADRFLAELREADPRLAGMAEHIAQAREASR